MAEHGNENQTWIGRPWAARAVGAVVYVVPLVASVAAAFGLTSILPDPATFWWGVFRWIGVAIASTIVLVGVERQMRRLLPLRALLGLTLAFPDRAPSRFKIAIRTGTTNQLQKRLGEARAGKLGDTPGEAAERLLELVGMLSQHDRLTRGHSERVRAYAHLIGEEMGMTGAELDRLRWAGLLHDVGKLEIDPKILNKPGELTAAEWEAIKTHPMEGKRLTAPLADWLGDAARAVWEHHERIDGTGYPLGLAGPEISLAARIVSVADVFDVMTSVRSYKHASSPADARAELARCAGTQFDPDVVKAFLAVSVSRVRGAMGPLSWLAQLALFPQFVAAQAGPTLATTAAVTVGAAAGTVGIAATPTELVAAEDSAAEQVVGDFHGLEFVEPADTVVFVGWPDAVNGLIRPNAVTDTNPDDAASTPVGTDPTEDPDQDPSGTPTDDTSVVDTSVVDTSVVDTSDSERPSVPDESTTTTSPTTPLTTTTTTPPATTTTTTTTTLPPVTTTTTTLPPATTTTTVPIDVDDWYLGVGVSGDTASSSPLPLVNGAPTETTLYNYDTDRDGAPGLLISKDAAGVNGTDPTKVQVFAVVMTEEIEFDHDARVELYVAAEGFSSSDVHVEVGLYHCDAGDNCTTLASDDRIVRNATWFKKVVISLDEIELTVGAGERIELRVAALDDSDDDMWLAYATDAYDARVVLND